MKIMFYFFKPVNVNYQEHNRVQIFTLVSPVQIDVYPCRGRAFLWVAGCVLFYVYKFHISP